MGPRYTRGGFASPPGVRANAHRGPDFEEDFMIFILCCRQRKVNRSSWLLGKGCAFARAGCAWHQLRHVPESTVGCRQMYTQKHSSTRMHQPCTRLPQHTTQGHARPCWLPLPLVFLLTGLLQPLSLHLFVVWLLSLSCVLASLSLFLCLCFYLSLWASLSLRADSLLVSLCFSDSFSPALSVSLPVI